MCIILNRLPELSSGPMVLHIKLGFNTLKPIASPLDFLPKVHFRTELFAYTNKSTQHPEYLRQAALELIDSIPEGAILIYADGPGGTLNNLRAASPLVMLVEGKERWMAPDHLQGVLPQN
ncbi:uncharacterized protein TNCV_2361231 [Trichonephila clavipes]|nr:uncharacterized protein TNCV_2361231 [Trichonephila clavipes]